MHFLPSGGAEYVCYEVWIKRIVKLVVKLVIFLFSFQAFAKIQERENELRKLRDGTYDFSRKRANIDLETVRGEAFERYLEIFYKRPCIDIPDDNLEDDEQDYEDEEEPYAPDMGTGFFSISRQSNRSKKGQASPEKDAPKPPIMSLSMSEFEPLKLEDDSGDSPVLPPTKKCDEMSRWVC